MEDEPAGPCRPRRRLAPHPGPRSLPVALERRRMADGAGHEFLGDRPGVALRGYRGPGDADVAAGVYLLLDTGKQVAGRELPGRNRNREPEQQQTRTGMRKAATVE